MNKEYVFGGKLVVLRLFRLGRIPPALSSTEIMAESGIPTVVVEYGNLREPRKRVPGVVPRRRFQSSFAALVPRGLRPIVINATLVLRLAVRFLFEGRPRLIVAHGIQEQSVALFLNIVAQVPYAVHVHEIYEEWELSRVNRLFFRLESLALKRADFLIFSEQSRAEIYERRYDLRNPMFFAANSARLRPKPKGLALRECLSLPKESVLMAYVGGLGPENLLEEAIRATARVHPVCFLIWGWGNEPYLKRLHEVVDSLGIEDRVLFLGELDARLKWEHLAGCDISYCVYQPKLLRMKYQATASNKLMEAMVCGVPVLTSAEWDFRQIVDSLDIGVAVESIGVEGLADGLATLAGDELGRKRKGANARKLHETLFNYEIQFADVLKEVGSYFPGLPQTESKPFERLTGS